MTTEEKLMRLPVVSDWVEFKGEIYYSIINYEATDRAKKPMIDLHYCATKALNNIVQKTVQWDKSKFKSCHLTFSKF